MPYMPQEVTRTIPSSRAMPKSQHVRGRSIVDKTKLTTNQVNDAQLHYKNSSLINDETKTAEEAWQIVLTELAQQMPVATFDTWVRDTWIVSHENDEYIIGLPNSYARDWLENRLRNTIKRTLSSIVHRSVRVQFQVCTPTMDDSDTELTPLQKMVEEAEVMAEEVAKQTAKIEIDLGESTNHRSTIQESRAAETIQPSSMEARVHTALTKDTLSEMSQSSPSIYTPQSSSTLLNPQHTFETFVVGNHNRLAHAAASAVAENPGQSFNPLFIYGGVGLGKTHLLHSIGNRAQQNGSVMIYCTSEQFTNELISAIRNQNTEAFRNKYRQTDILLIDDIQFIGGKESTQEEFFHTFNHLHSGGRQVILSSDRPPKALATLEERLRSRFEGGLQTDISKPDFETRVAILQSKSARMAEPIPQDVLMLVAERVDSNIRELEGALNRLMIQAQLANANLNLALAMSILDNLAPQRTPCTPDRAVGIVAEHFQLSPDDLLGRKRTKEVAHARQVAMYLLREENGLSLPAIGTQLGGRDHSTIRYGVEKIAEDLNTDEALRREVILLRDKIYTPFI